MKQAATTDPLLGLERSLEKTRAWIREVQDELERAGPSVQRLRRAEPQEGYHALRALLHLLRDHLPAPEVAHLGAQLPIVVRGLYYECWRPGAHEKRDAAAELERVQRELGRESGTDPAAALRAAFVVLSRHVSPGEVADVVGALPAALRSLLA